VQSSRHDSHKIRGREGDATRTIKSPKVIDELTLIHPYLISKSAAPFHSSGSYGGKGIYLQPLLDFEKLEPPFGPM
jgi:hypothetical protein